MVVDGNSTDSTKSILTQYGPQLAWSVSEPDSGHGNALNKGFRRASGDILCWLNSDDFLAPGSLWSVAEIFLRFPKIEWLMGLPTVWDRNGRGVQTVVRRRNRLDHLRGRFGIQQESCFWRRSLWDRAGGYIDESYKLMIDSELWSRFFSSAELWHVDAVLGGYRWHGDNRAITGADLGKSESERAFASLHMGLTKQEAGVVKEVSAYDSLLPSNGIVSRIRKRTARPRLVSLLKPFAYRVVRWRAGVWETRTETYDL